jgi:hypothetical protein
MGVLGQVMCRGTRCSGAKSVVFAGARVQRGASCHKGIKAPCVSGR